MLSDEWRNSEFIKQQADEAAAHYAEVIRADMVEHLLKFQEFCHSPIEAVFYMWWIGARTTLEAVLGPYLGLSSKWDVRPQQKVDIEGTKYRVDFEVAPDDWAWLRRVREVWPDFPRIAIELDGHDFHERTREQVDYRNARDRALQSAGWKVFHFSGSEVVRTPTACVFEVIGYVRGLHDAGEKRLAEHEKAKASSQDAQLTHGTNQDDQT